MAGLQTNGLEQLELARRKSIKMGDVPVGGSTILQLFVPSSPQRSLLPPALPPTLWQRDRILSLTPRADAQWGAAIGIAVTKVASLAWEVKSDIGLRSKRAQDLCLNADSALGQGGWVHYVAKQVRDYLCTNNGCVTEIVRESMAYGSRIVGINHLPSIRCRRTGLPEKPIIYIDKLGQEHLLNWWQVMYFCDLPDPDENLFGGGLCSAERAYPQIIKMAALESFVYEKVSATRPLAVHIISGLKTEQIEDAIKAAEDQMSREGMTSYMGAVIMATINPTQAPSIVTIPLAELPNGFDAKEERDRADLIYSNAIGLDPQDLVPLATSQLGTATQSLVLHDKAKGRGLMMFRQAFVHGMNQLVLDDRTRFVFTERDYEDQKKQAEVSRARADLAKTRIDATITTPDQEREILVDQDELPKSFITADTIPGESLSDTDKEKVDEPREGPEPVAEPPTPEMGSEATSSEEPYLLTVGKSKDVDDGLFVRSKPRVSKRGPVDLSEDQELLKLVEQMMRGLSPYRDISTKMISVARCRNCNHRLINTKACHHCGHNFHPGGSGGGGGYTSSMVKKMTPKLAKVILASGQGSFSDEDKKAAAQHLHDKGYIGHSQYQKELSKIGGGNVPSKAPGGSSTPTTAQHKFSDASHAYNSLKAPHTTPEYKVSASQHLLTDPNASTAQKIAANGHLFDKGHITKDQFESNQLKIMGGPGAQKDMHLGTATPVKTPSVGTSITKFTNSTAAHDYIVSPTATGQQKLEAATHILSDPKASVNQVHAAAEHLYKKGLISKDEFDAEIAKVSGTKTPPSTSGPQVKFQTPGQADKVLADPKATNSQKAEAAEHLFKMGLISQDEYESHTKPQPQQQSASSKWAPVTKPSHANQVLSDPNAPTGQKLEAAKLLYDKGYLGKKTYDLKVQSINSGGTVTPQHVQQSALNAAQSKVNAHINPSQQNTVQSQTAQQHANSVKGSVAHEVVPKNVVQFVGAQGSTSTLEAEKWGKQHYEGWLNGLPQDQKSALKTYTGGSYDSINNHLRAGGKPTSQDRLRDKALASGKTPEDLLVHRGFTHAGLLSALEAGTIAPGTVLHDKGYVSTSLHSERAFTNKIRMRATVPAGSPGGYVEKVSNHPQELEFLLPRGSSFVIRGYQKVTTASGSTYWLVDADYVGSGEVFGA